MKFEKGQTLFEVVLAIGMMAAILIGIVSLAALAVRNSTFSKNKTLATRYAQEMVEWLRSERDNNYDIFAAKSALDPGLTYCFDEIGATWPPMNYSGCGSGDEDKIAGTSLFREVNLTTSESLPVTGEPIQITATVKVYWTDGRVDHEVRSVTYLTDWRER